MAYEESRAIILKADPEQFRVTVLDEQRGKVRAIFFGTLSAGTLLRATLTPHSSIPTLRCLEMVAMPCVLARTHIGWLHLILALVDACVPAGGGIGTLFDQIAWLCSAPLTLDKSLQILYCAKMVVSLGLHANNDGICEHCIYILHATRVDTLHQMALHDACASQLVEWISSSIKHHVGSGMVPYIYNTHYEE